MIAPLCVGGECGRLVWTAGRTGVDGLVWTDWCGRAGVDGLVWTAGTAGNYRNAGMTSAAKKVRVLRISSIGTGRVEPKSHMRLL